MDQPTTSTYSELRARLSQNTPNTAQNTQNTAQNAQNTAQNTQNTAQTTQNTPTFTSQTIPTLIHELLNSPEEPKKHTLEFKGLRKPSKHGARQVLVYNVPGTDIAYTFQHQRSNKKHDQFTCSRCKLLRKYVAVKVIGDYFLEDPSKLDHTCEPQSCSGEQAIRIGYEVKRQVRSTDPSERKKPVQIWEDVLSQIESNPDLDEEQRELIVAKWREGGLKRQRSSISRAVNAKPLPESVTEKVSNHPEMFEANITDPNTEQVDVIRYNEPILFKTEVDDTSDFTDYSGSFDREVTPATFNVTPAAQPTRSPTRTPPPKRAKTTSEPLSNKTRAEFNPFSSMDAIRQHFMGSELFNQFQPAQSSVETSPAEPEQSIPEAIPNPAQKVAESFGFKKGTMFPPNMLSESFNEYVYAVGLHTLFTSGMPFPFPNMPHLFNNKK